MLAEAMATIRCVAFAQTHKEQTKTKKMKFEQPGMESSI